MVWLLAALAWSQDDVADSVVRLVQDGHTCAGTVLAGSDEVLTAYHCVVGGRSVQVFDASDRKYRGRVVRTDRSRDTAWVVVEGLGLPGATVASSAPGPGDSVIAIGHPYGGSAPAGFFEGTLRYSLSAGVVSAVGPRAIQTTAPVNPGNSGGPLVDADTQQIVGVVSRRMGRDGVGFAGRVRDVEDGYSWLGGRVGASALGQLGMAVDGVFTVGARVRATVRDRLEVRADGLVPIDARWDAARFGSARYRRAGVDLAVTLPVVRGGQPVSVSLAGGVAAATQLTGEGDSVAITRETVAAPEVSASICAFGLEVQTTLMRTDAQWSTVLGVGVAWPGTLFVW